VLKRFIIHINDSFFDTLHVPAFGLDQPAKILIGGLCAVKIVNSEHFLEIITEFIKALGKALQARRVGVGGRLISVLPSPLVLSRLSANPYWGKPQVGRVSVVTSSWLTYYQNRN
jgi:hypothetical protein